MKSDRNASTANLHHNLILEDRANMNLSGVTDVDCFDERTIRLYTQLGELVIKGRNLHIDSVSVETGDMRISGDIWSLQYGDRDRKGPLSALGKLFR
ncbi:MAG: YabP/YqfC family sporulation protein [Oscillospiraceae bacterium]|nr:YabP/YqfC family sporulation protein [Oscillospiraceae bacterium]MDD7294418.1 YabP/YqfC family sporulation protein [Oscillospiraceae bacterium]MDY2510361.1 YabP/YqfC family sporulation protein [Ruminococcus callidus]